MSTEKKEESSYKLAICKPINMKNIAYHYIPLMGAVNYATLSINVMHPSLISRLIPSRDVTNILLAHSVVGTSLYIYSRPHMKLASQQSRILYSGFNSMMFNFGSVLVWAVLRTVTRSQCIATIIGLVSGIGMAAAGRSCLQYLDNNISTQSSSK